MAIPEIIIQETLHAYKRKKRTFSLSRRGINSLVIAGALCLSAYYSYHKYGAHIPRATIENGVNTAIEQSLSKMYNIPVQSITPSDDSDTTIAGSRVYTVKGWMDYEAINIPMQSVYIAHATLKGGKWHVYFRFWNPMIRQWIYYETTN